MLAAFGQLTASRRLHPEKNLLTALPESFGQLAALQDLHLWGNQVSALPESYI